MSTPNCFPERLGVCLFFQKHKKVKKRSINNPSNGETLWLQVANQKTALDHQQQAGEKRKKRRKQTKRHSQSEHWNSVSPVMLEIWTQWCWGFGPKAVNTNRHNAVLDQTNHQSLYLAICVLPSCFFFLKQKAFSRTPMNESAFVPSSVFLNLTLELQDETVLLRGFFFLKTHLPMELSRSYSQ